MKWPKPEILDDVPSMGPVVLEASAGTGKTYTIEHVVIDFVLKGVPLAEILVVTYTEKATLELKARIRDLLTRMRRQDLPQETSPSYWDIDEAGQGLLDEALASFDRASIFTMHGFCKRVLTDQAFVGGHLFDQDMADEKTLVGRAFREGLRQAYLTQTSWQPLFEAFLVDGSLSGLEQDLFEAQKRGIRVVPQFSPEAYLEEAAGATKQLGPVFQRILDYWPQSGFDGRVYSSRVKKLKEAKGCLEDLTSQEQLPAFFKKVHKQYTHWLKPNERKENTKFLFPEMLPENILQDYQALQDWFGRVPTLKAALVSLISEDIKARVAARKLETGVMDFDDLLYEVGRALDIDDTGALLGKLRQQYRVGIIDEFQDTNPVQWSIFHRLFANHDTHRLFLVGDPKQAIYAFNGADVYTYIKAVKTLEEEGAPKLPLKKNYRSSQAMIEFCNAFFQGSSDRGFFEGELCSFQPVQCGSPHEQTSSDQQPVALMALDATVLPDPGVRSMVWARWMAKEIKALLETHAQWCARDIFVLCRKGKEVRAMGRSLQKAGLPFAFFKERGLFSSAEAKDVLCMLLALKSPADRQARQRAFLTPFFGGLLSDLALLNNAATDHPWVKRIFAWAKWAHAGRFDDLFDALLYQSGLLEREALLAPHQRVSTNLAHILEVLLLENGGAISLDSAIEQLQGFMSGARSLPVESGDETRVEPNEDAVQVMTMHKAKGLEAKVVFVYGGFSKNINKSFTYFHDEHGERVLSFHKEDKPLGVAEARQEDQRLLYVALTRAKTLMYLPFLENGHPKDLHGVQRDLQPRLLDMLTEKTLEPQAPLTPRPKSLEPSIIDFDLEGWTPPEAKEPQGVASVRFGAKPMTLSSYSSLKSSAAEAEVLSRGMQLDDEVSVAQADARGLPRGKAFGLLLHDLLEQVPLSGLKSGQKPSAWLKKPEVKNLFAKVFAARGFSPEWMPAAGDMVHKALTGTYEIDQEVGVSVTDAQRVFREMPFMFPFPQTEFPPLSWAPELSVTRGFLHGFVDLIFEAEGRVYAADWKSDALPDYGAQSLLDHAKANYSLQQNLYTLALVKMYGLVSKAQYDQVFGGFGFVFLRGLTLAEAPGAVFERPDFEEVVAFEEELKAGPLYEMAHPWP